MAVFDLNDLKFVNDNYGHLAGDELIQHFKNNSIIFEKNKIVCSYSYGIVNFPADGKGYEELIKIADKRMYEYKSIVKSKKR